MKIAFSVDYFPMLQTRNVYLFVDYALRWPMALSFLLFLSSLLVCFKLLLTWAALLQLKLKKIKLDQMPILMLLYSSSLPLLLWLSIFFNKLSLTILEKVWHIKWEIKLTIKSLKCQFLGLINLKMLVVLYQPD